jgi:hypothetical protein
MITCKDCKFWALISEYQDRAECICDKIRSDYDIPELGRDEAQVEADEGWGIMTGPDFGCIHGAKK